MQYLGDETKARVRIALVDMATKLGQKDHDEDLEREVREPLVDAQLQHADQVAGEPMDVEPLVEEHTRENFMSAMMSAMIPTSANAERSDSDEERAPAIRNRDCRAEVTSELEVYLQQPLMKNDTNAIDYWSSC